MKGSKRIRSDEKSEIVNAILAADAASAHLKNLINVWRKENKVCFGVYEYNSGYFYAKIISYHLTQKAAERAKPENTSHGWEQYTYTIGEVETVKLCLETIKSLFKS